MRRENDLHTDDVKNLHHVKSRSVNSANVKVSPTDLLLILVSIRAG